MNQKELNSVVEKNIMDLFKTFNYNTGFFRSERDVQSYLYALLMNDPSLQVFPKLKNFSTPNIENPETLLVHADNQIEIRKMKGFKKVDISILPPKKQIDYDTGKWAIGIEIKFNRSRPARKEASSILHDVKKCADFEQGYVLWLNWDRPISDLHLKAVENLVKKCANVKFFYLDVYTNPKKTNVPNL